MRTPFLKTERGQEILLWVRDMRDDGLTWNQVADELNAAGFLSPSGRPWSVKRMQNIFNWVVMHNMVSLREIQKTRQELGLQPTLCPF